ncbi:hypothetical protein [Streptomyces sp. NPDC048508]|uniref:hypothetical protein n=1 Tax=Streptomyces sp. NPDC048508 TaxID=3365561 RepID=UPI003722BBF3
MPNPEQPPNDPISGLASILEHLKDTDPEFYNRAFSLCERVTEDRRYEAETRRRGVDRALVLGLGIIACVAYLVSRGNPAYAVTLSGLPLTSIALVFSGHGPAALTAWKSSRSAKMNLSQEIPPQSQSRATAADHTAVSNRS